jgi:hypothetical protein
MYIRHVYLETRLSTFSVNKNTFFNGIMLPNATKPELSSVQTTTEILTTASTYPNTPDGLLDTSVTTEGSGEESITALPSVRSGETMTATTIHPFGSGEETTKTVYSVGSGEDNATASTVISPGSSESAVDVSGTETTIGTSTTTPGRSPNQYSTTVAATMPFISTDEGSGSHEDIVIEEKVTQTTTGASGAGYSEATSIPTDSKFSHEDNSINEELEIELTTTVRPAESGTETPTVSRAVTTGTKSATTNTSTTSTTSATSTTSTTSITTMDPNTDPKSNLIDEKIKPIPTKITTTTAGAYSSTTPKGNKNQSLMKTTPELSETTNESPTRKPHSVLQSKYISTHRVIFLL